EKQALLESHAQLLEAQIESQNQVLQRRIEHEQLLSAMAEQIRSSLELPEILNTIVSQLRQVLKCERVNIWQFINDDWDAQVIAESSLSDCSLIGVQLQNPCFKAGYAELYHQGRIRVVSDVYRANLAPAHLEMLERIHTRAKIIVPILFDDKLWGLLNVSEGKSTRTWEPDEIEFVSMLTGHVGLALQQAHTYQQLQRELRERQESEAILQHLLAGTATATGPSFFPALVQHLAEALKVSCVLVAELRDQQFQTLAVWQDGQLQANFSYTLSEPCLHRLHEQSCFCLNQGLFPENLGGMQLTTCLGARLENHEGKLIGIIRILDVRPLDNPLLQEILKSFA
ncbi:MAG: GAF domain-containing protein, partial [Prochlorotrichaceae cyanobacterium]